MSYVGEPGRCALVGMVHLRPLPGSPNWDGDMAAILQSAQDDADALLAGGCDALIVENMGDLPYLRRHVDPETIAAMTLATHAVVQRGAPTGVQVLAGANREALGVAVAAGAHFLRVEAFAYAHIADEGLLEACAGTLLRARRALSADISIWADVQKKHAAHTLTADLSVAALAEGHRFCGADVLIVTGASTGHPTDPAVLAEAATAGLPVAVGSGVTPDNAASLSAASALIVGSYLKENGDWRRRVDTARVVALRKAIDAGE